MITLIALSRLIAMETKQPKRKEKTMNPLTHFKTTKILRNIFLSLGALFALVTAAHAQNLYVSANVPGSHTILEFTSNGTQDYLRFGLVLPARVGL